MPGEIVLGFNPPQTHYKLTIEPGKMSIALLTCNKAYFRVPNKLFTML